MLKLKCHKIRIKKTLKKRVLIAFDSRANKKVDQYHHSMFTINKDKFFRKMKLDRESFDCKYVSDEIISNLILAQDYPTVLPYKGHFPVGMFKNNEAFHFMASHAHICLDFNEQT